MMDTQTIAEAVGGDRLGGNAWIDAVSTDSRKVKAGNLFVALRGERFDGHEYLNEAYRKGARATMVETAVGTQYPQVLVQDTERALGQLSAFWRGSFHMPLVAVTGSCGKTTVKEMIGNILTCKAETLVSQGNFNNAIGLPLSLLKLKKKHQFAVVEIGMNQIGEIEHLSKLASPTVAVITNAGPAHLKFLNSVDQVATEKGSIVSGVNDSGVVVLNHDDRYFDFWKESAAPRSVISFGFTDKADVSGSCQLNESGASISMKTPIGSMVGNISLIGAHNVSNALAATAAAIGLNVSKRCILQGLAKMSAIKGRLQIRRHKYGGRLIDDTYNANPASAEAAIRILSKIKGDRRLVVGDMFELGPDRIRFHQEIGRCARDAGIGRLYCVGNLSEFTAKAFGRGASYYQSKQELLSDLELQIDADTTLLVKGSRGMRMEKITDFLCANGVAAQEVGSC